MGEGIKIGGGGASISKLMNAFGCTKYAVDVVTFASRVNIKTEVQHSLGETPKVVFIRYAGDSFPMAQYNVKKILSTKYDEYSTILGNTIYASSTTAYAGLSSTILNTLTSTSVKGTSSSYYYVPGTYELVTMA